MQGFARVNISQTRDHALIEERDFERGLLAPERLGEGVCVECGRQRLGAEAAQDRVARALCRGKQRHQTKAARIVEDHGRA